MGTWVLLTTRRVDRITTCFTPPRACSSATTVTVLLLPLLLLLLLLLVVVFSWVGCFLPALLCTAFEPVAEEGGRREEEGRSR